MEIVKAMINQSYEGRFFILTAVKTDEGMSCHDGTGEPVPTRLGQIEEILVNLQWANTLADAFNMYLDDYVE